MSWRFQRRIGIAPGLRLNISKSGVSASLGPRGAHITIGKTPRVTVGIPGSGLSYTETLPHGRRAPQGAPQPVQPRPGWQVAIIVIGLLALLAIIASGGHP